MRASDISAVLVTRGNVDLTPILEALTPVGFREISVWDNRYGDFSVFGRYMAIAATTAPIIYTQDDDCIVPVEQLLAEYRDGERLCNMPDWKQAEYPHSALVGWGALFPREAPDEAFARYRFGSPGAGEFWRCCDCVFTTLAPFRKVSLGHRDLPWATAPDRMYRAPQHYTERARITQEALACV